MTHKHSFLRCLSSAALILTASACGGGGSTEAAATAADAIASIPAAAEQVPSAPNFNGTAHLKTRNTILFAGKDYGLTRAALQAQVDLCNGHRSGFYELPPVSPPEDVMASTDVRVKEQFFDTNKALTIITGTLLDFTDYRRWMDDLKESASSGNYPLVPPDCAKVSVIEGRSGTLWRDGMTYILRYDTLKALGNKTALIEVPYTAVAAFADLPIDHQLGKTCREVVNATSLNPDSHACMWDLFPYVAYLNWPWALSGRVQFAPTPGMFETIELLEAEDGMDIDPAVFDIPADFTVIL